MYVSEMVISILILNLDYLQMFNVLTIETFPNIIFKLTLVWKNKLKPLCDYKSIIVGNSII